MTTAEKRRILLNSIYGVDIDPQAVEVTKLSLLLKVLEGENEDSLGQQMAFFQERALPDLNNNIKCGNSLIEPDFYNQQGQQIEMFDIEEMYRVNAFEWDAEFAEIMRAGGFDAVLGNPPYVFGRDWKALDIGDDIKDYLRSSYTSPYQLDMFSIFMEKSLILCALSGYIGQIVPNVWLTNIYSSTTRAFVFKHANKLKFLVPPNNVFPGITVDTIVYSYKKSETIGETFTIDAMKDSELKRIALHETKDYADGKRPVSTSLDSKSADMLFRIKSTNPELNKFADITRGVHPYRTGGYGETAFGSGSQTSRDVKERPYHSNDKLAGYRPFIYGKDLNRFETPQAREYVKYGKWLAEPRNPMFFEGPRVYSRKILADRLLVTIETLDTIADQQVYITKPKVSVTNAAFLAGILGSKFMAFFIRGYYDEANDAFPQIKVGQLKSLPIPINPNFETPVQHDEIVALVESMMGLNKKLNEAKTTTEKKIILRKIENTDTQIDELVYELYGLSEEEIEIVESGL